MTDPHHDTSIPEPLLAAIARWLLTVVNKLRVSDQPLEDADAPRVLRDLLGKDVTFGLLRELTGAMVMDELRERGVKLPRNAERIFTSFARTWSPEGPSCPSCDLPAVRPLQDRSGVEILPEGTLCPWCGSENVRVTRFQGALTSWVTGRQVPLDTEFDDTTVRGTRLPLQEKALRDMTREDLRQLLDSQGVPVHAWLRHLLLTGHQVFGLPRAPLAVLNSLRNDAVTQYGHGVVAAQVLAAKRQTAPPGTGAVTLVRSADGDVTENLVYDLLCRLPDSQFEVVLFNLRVARHHISAAAAPLATRARELMQLQRSGALRLQDIYSAARAMLSPEGHV